MGLSNGSAGKTYHMDKQNHSRFKIINLQQEKNNPQRSYLPTDQFEARINKITLKGNNQEKKFSKE